MLGYVSIQIPTEEIDKKSNFYIKNTDYNNLKYMSVYINKSPTCCGMGEIGGIYLSKDFFPTLKGWERASERGMERLMFLIKNYMKLDQEFLTKTINRVLSLADHKSSSYLRSSFNKGVWNLTWVKGDGYLTGRFCEKYGLKEVHQFHNPNSGNEVHMCVLNHKDIPGYKGEFFHTNFDKVRVRNEKEIKSKEGFEEK